MKERVGYIYLLVNLINGKRYVGQTIYKPTKRWREHIYASLTSDNPLYRALRKYGVENFSAEVVHSCTESKLNAAEVRFIKKFNTFIDNGCGYNLTTVGGSTTKFSKVTCKKMSTSIRRAIADPAVHAKYVAAANTRWSVCTFQQREEHRIAVKSGMKAKPWVPTTEHRESMSKAGKLRWENPKHRAHSLRKFRIAAQSPELRSTRSENAKLFWSNPENKAKMSLLQKERRVRERKLANAEAT